MTPIADGLRGQAGPGLTGLQLRIFVVCALLLICDGFDLVAISYAAPHIVREMGPGPAAMARLFATAVIGMAIGGLILGPLGDRFGTRRVLATTTLLAAVGTLLVSFAKDLDMLIAGRLLTGIALGGAMPAAFAIVADFAPHERRRTILSIVGVAYGAGGALAGVFASIYVPSLGWRALFHTGAAATLLSGLAVLVLIPESPGYLLRQGAMERLRSVLARLSNTVVIPAASNGGQMRSPVRLLLSPEWRRLTLTLWLASFLTLMIIYLLVSWLPTIISERSGADGTGALGGLLFQAGAAFGGLLVGWCMDRFGAVRITVAASLLLALATFGAALVSTHAMLLVAACSLIGFCTAAAQGSINMLAVVGYPERARVTGTAFVLSIGRFGAILGPLLGGALVGWRLPMEAFFLVAMLAAAAAAAAMYVALRGDFSAQSV